MPAKSDPRAETGGAGTAFYYRRPLSGSELLPAVAVGVAAGLAAFYLARIVMQRTPLEGARGVPAPRPSRTPRSRGG